MKEIVHNARIYLAGHTGLVGSAIVRAFRARGYENLIVRTRAELDLTDQVETDRLFVQERPEVVIIAAARVGGILANRDYPYEFVRDNLAIELSVIDTAFRRGVRRLLFLGSSCIYPKLAPQPLKEEYLLTGLLEETNRPYAVAKIAGIELCRSLNREYGTEYLSLMPSNLYGPGDDFDPESGHVVPGIIRKFYEKKCADVKGRAPSAARSPVVLWGTGAPRRELLYVDDLAEAVCLLLETEDWAWIPDGLINIGTGTDVTIAELAEVAQKVVGYEGPVEWDTGKPDGTPRKLLDTSRIRSLGWSPRTGLEDGIRKTYEWFLREQAESRVTSCG